MLDPTQPNRSFLLWGLLGQGRDGPVFVSFKGQLCSFKTRQEARDFNHLAFQDKHKVVKIRLTLEREK